MSKANLIADEPTEAALLSSMLCGGGVWCVEPSLFQGKQHRELCVAILDLDGRSQTVNADSIMLLTKDENLAKLADKLVTRPPGVSPSLLISRLQEVRDRARLADVCRRGHEAAFNEDEDIKEALDVFESEALGIRPIGSRVKRGGDMKAVLDLIKWKALNPGKIRGRTTGYDKLDVLSDGLLGGEMIILAARPSCGKTALMSNMIETEIHSGGTPLVFSMEMAETSLKMRLLAAVARVATRMERPWTPAEQKALADAIRKMAGWNWFLDETERADVRYIRSTARKLKKEKKVTSIWIDYLQLARGVRKSSQTDRRVEVGECSGEFKAMAKELDVPVIVCAQIKRPLEVYDRVEKRTMHQEPELHHLKESGDIEQDADQVGLLDRDQRENSTKATLIWAKNRNGPTGRVELEYQPEICRFKQAS
jgi:replicative DNA helicase